MVDRAVFITPRRGACAFFFAYHRLAPSACFTPLSAMSGTRPSRPRCSRPAASGHKRRMAAYVLTAAAMSLPALGVLRCCCRRRVFTAASASLSTRPVIIDTDCALDDLATLALAAATGTSLQLVTTVNGLAPPGHGHELVRLHGQKRLTWQRRSSAVCLLGAARHSP